MSLTSMQIKRFFPEAKRAADNLGLSIDEYKVEILRSELGVEHLHDVTKTSGYDKLMQRVFADQGNYERAMDFVGGDVKRLRFLATRAATRILLNKGETSAGDMMVAKYIASVFFQMGFTTMDRDAMAFKLMRPDGWDDFTDLQIKKVVAALQKHVRRIGVDAAACRV